MLSYLFSLFLLLLYRAFRFSRDLLQLLLALRGHPSLRTRILRGAVSMEVELQENYKRIAPGMGEIKGSSSVHTTRGLPSHACSQADVRYAR